MFQRKVCRRRTPHSSKDLSKTTDETGHTDDSVRNNDTAGMDVVHGEDEGGTREREETTVEVVRSANEALPGRRDWMILTEDQGCR